MKQNFLMRGVGLVAVGEPSLLRAQELVLECEACSPLAFTPFGSLLNDVLGESHSVAEYVLCSPAHCPKCAAPIIETSLVRFLGEPEGDEQNSTKYFEPCWEKTNVVLIDEATLHEAEEFISGCEDCVKDAAEITFDYLLDAVTECDPTVTEYVMCRPARCPRCYHDVTEKTLVASN